MTQVFEHGELFEEVWKGVGVVAEVRIAHSTLHLLGVTMYSIGPTEVRLGITGNRRWLRRILRLAKVQGFSRVVMHFDRLTGANPRDGRMRAFDLEA